MQDHTVIIGGFESVYMKKLALYLGGRMGDRVRIGIAESSTPDADEDTVWIGSEQFLESVKSRSKDAACILLTEKNEDEEAIYRYQSCEKLYQQIILRYRQFYGKMEEPSRSQRQKWIVITTDETVTTLLAFSVTCAQILGERSKVLYLNLSECSGMAELFLQEAGADFSDLASALRKEDDLCFDAFVRQMEGMDYIMPPANPMILHELRQDDAGRLIQLISRQEEYDYVVAALGSTCCGCERFFEMAKRIFHLTQKGYPGECSQREWIDFISRCVGSGKTEVERIPAPQITAASSGIHLIHAWQEGPLGQLARIYLEGE